MLLSLFFQTTSSFLAMKFTLCHNYDGVDLNDVFRHVECDIAYEAIALFMLALLHNQMGSLITLINLVYTHTHTHTVVQVWSY